MKPKPQFSFAAPLSRRRASALAAASALIFFSLAFSQSAQAETAYWNGTGGNFLWATTGNWRLNADDTGDVTTVPGTGDTAYFNVTALNTNQSVAIGTATLSLAGMVFNTTGTTGINVAASTGAVNTSITLGSGGLTLNPDAGAVTFANVGATNFRTAFVLGAAQTWTNNSTLGALTLSGTTNSGVNNSGNLLTLDGSGAIFIAGNISGAGGLIKNGAGSLNLTGLNTYSGGTTLSNGTLRIGPSVGSVGAITNSAVGTGALVLNGGTLSANAGAARIVLNALTIGGDVTLGDATNTGPLTFSANTDLGGGPRMLTTASAVTFSSGIVDNGGIIKAGSGTLTLSGANTYTGGTTLTSGTLSVGASNNLGGAASALVFDGGTLQITGTALTNFTGMGHTVSFNADKTVVLDIATAANTFTVDQLLNQGTGGLTKLGNGALVLNQANTYSGVTTITSAQVSITAANNLGDGSATNSITLGGGTLILTAGTVDLGTTRAITLLAHSNLQVDTGAQLTVSGLISGAFRLTVLGDGTTILSNTNNDFANLTIGTTKSIDTIVKVSSITDAGVAGPLGSGNSIQMGSGEGRGQLRLVDSTAPQTTDRTIGISSGAGSQGTATIANDNTNPDHTLTFTGSTFNLPTTASGGGKTVALSGSNTGNNAINGVIQDNTGAIVKLTKDGAGTWSLFGNNTYTGMTTVANGTLSLARVGGTIADTAAVTVNGGTLDVAQSDTVGLVTLSGGTISGAGTLTGSSFSLTGTGTANAVLAGSAGAGSTLTKTGIGGTAVLSGANTYAGKTSIGQGFLSVASLNYVTSGTWGNHSASNLGAPTTVADGTISMGQSAQRGTLIYTGAGETTDRVIDMAGGAGGAAIDQSGSSGLLKFTSALTMSSTVQTTKTLYLLGSAGGSGEFAGAIVNGGAGGPTVVQVDKAGSGTWTLSGHNTYTGNTNVSEGTLVLAATGRLAFHTGSASGAGHNSITRVTPDTGTLVLDGSFVIDTSATDATALTSGSWLIENVDNLTGPYGDSFTVVGWNDEGDNTWTTTVGTKEYTFDETTGTVAMVATADPYASWMAPFITGGLTGDTTATGDPDNDGMNNLLEYALNGNPGTSDPSILPDLVVTTSDFEFTYSRLDLSMADTAQTFEYGTTLTGWNPVVIPAGPGVFTVGIVTVTVTDAGSTDTIKVSIAKSAFPGGKLFGRLQVVK